MYDPDDHGARDYEFEVELEAAVLEMKDAVDFFDRVLASSADGREAVGGDHWDWLERAARRVAACSDGFQNDR